MEPVSRSKNRSTALLIVEVTVIIVSLVAFIGVGFFAWAYYRNALKNLLPNTLRQNSSDSNLKTFTSNEVYQPTGTVVDLVSKASPAVVTVISKSDSTQNGFIDDNQSQGIGTGFFVSGDGLMITNEHVVCDSSKPENLSIVTSENKSYTVESFATDPVQDIAIVKVNTKSEKVPFLKFANPNTPIKVGEEVIAIGNPLGVNPGSVTKGIISGVNRNITAQGACQNRVTQKDYEGVLQTDAAINSGNSGGPLLDLSGEVVGVNSATSSGANNISYSIPFVRVLKLLDQFQKNNGKLVFPYLGVEYSMIDPNLAEAEQVPAGAFVRRVVTGSPAEKSGILRGDIITKIGDQRLEFSLQATLSQFFEPGQRVKVEVYRPNRTNILGQDIGVDGKYITFDLTIGQK